MSLTRKQFLSSMMGAVAGAAGVAFLVGCSSSESSPDAGGGAKNCVTNGTTVSIGGNHGHKLTVDKAEVSAAADHTYDITGTADHAHSVTVTAALFTTLKANTGVMVTSTSGAGHTHDISIGCL
ncbi:MAG: hypothetical protein ABIY55_14110 [Kofleriaceae bacterium]